MREDGWSVPQELWQAQAAPCQRMICQSSGCTAVQCCGPDMEHMKSKRSEILIPWASSLLNYKMRLEGG